MKKLFIMAVGLFLLTGCGKAEQTPTETVAAPTTMAVSDVRESAQVSDQFIQQGREQLQKGDVLAAIKNFDEAIKRDPRDVKNYLILGETYLHLQNYDKAIDTFSAAVALEPDNGPANYMLALAYNFRGDKELAIQRAQKSTQIFQDTGDMDNFRKSVLLLQGLTQVK